MTHPDQKTESDPSQPATKKRGYNQTPERKAASVANGKKGRGPRDTSNTRYNSTVHGCCSATDLVMGDESSIDIQAKVDLYCVQHGAVTEAEKDMARAAAFSMVKYYRCEKADAAAIRREAARVREQHQERLNAQLQGILAAGPGTNPVLYYLSLYNLSQGVLWLTAQIDALEKSLKRIHRLEASQRELLLILLGRNHKDLNDNVVTRVNRAYLSSIHGPGKLTVDEACSLLQNDLPDDMWENEFRVRIQNLLSDLTDKAEGKAQLLQLLGEARQPLTARLAVLIERERLDLEQAVEEAKVPVDKDGMNRARYAREHLRQAKTTLTQLSKMVKERLERGDDGLDESEGPSGDSDAAEMAAAGTPETASEEAETGVYRSEPIIPEVARGDATCDDEFGGSSEPVGPAPHGAEAEGVERPGQVPVEAPPGGLPG
jgi:hypothetical protein